MGGMNALYFAVESVQIHYPRAIGVCEKLPDDFMAAELFRGGDDFHVRAAGAKYASIGYVETFVSA